MRQFSQRHISPEEHSRMEADTFAHLGPTPERYQLEDRYREVLPARGWDGSPSKQKTARRKDEKGHLWSIGTRLERGGYGEKTAELSTGLLSKVYGVLAFSMLFTAVGVFVGYKLEPGWSLMIFFAQLGLIFAINANREQQGWNLVLLYAFCFATGLLLGPLVAAFVVSGHQAVLLQALAATAVITGSMFVIGLRVETNLYGWAPLLFVALLGFVVLHIINLFMGSPEVLLLLSYGGVLLFSIFLVVDINRVKFMPDTMGNAVLICLDIYLDIVNLFLNLLQILIEAAGEGD